MNSNITNSDHPIQTATLGNGCFWCTEAIFQQVEGVVSVTSGYSGGHTDNPDYKSVCTGETGHAECLEIRFDESVLPFEKLLEIFWETHDPTTLNRQGNDTGTQYRSVIFFHNDQQKQIAEKYIRQLNQSGIFANPVVTTLEPFKVFYPAEKYHQDYYLLNKNAPYCQFVVKPKVEKFRKEFGEIIKK